MTALNFNAAEVDPYESFDPIPVGEYVCKVADSEIKSTKAGTGTYLRLTLEVLEGDYKGRILWENINLTNPNQQAVEIGQKTLSALCHAVGVMNVSDSQQLHNIAFTAKIKVVPAKGEYDASNGISKYTKLSGQNPVQQAAQPYSQPPSQAPMQTEPVNQPAQATQQQPAPASQGAPWAQ